MQQIMRVRNYSERTQKIYLGAVAKFAAFFHRSPEKLGSEEILTYQLHLRDVRHVSFTFSITLDLLRAWWRASRPRELLFPTKDARRPAAIRADPLLRLSREPRAAQEHRTGPREDRADVAPARPAAPAAASLSRM
jgi:hypothetical protein